MKKIFKNNRNRNYTINNVSCTIISNNFNLYKIITRSMLTSRSLRSFIPNPLIGQYRNYPNQYSVGHLSYNARTGNGKNLGPHEYSHRILRRNSDGQLIGVFTTDPKNTFESLNIDKTELLNGNPVNADQVGQFVTQFDKPKVVETSIIKTDKPVFVAEPKYQGYVDKHEEKFNEFYKHKITCEVRVDKDDSRFFNENGTRDYENFP